MVRRYFIPALLGLIGVGCSIRAADDDDEDSTNGSTSDDGSTSGDPEPAPGVVEPIPAYAPVQGGVPAAAFDGTQYLVVWDDHRLRRSTLYGGRVSADGTALDPYGFEILDVLPETENIDEYGPAVAFDGENFLVITVAAGRSIYGVRVSPAGEVLDPGGFLIADTQVLVTPPSIVFDGERYLVVWGQSAPGSSGIFQARVEPDATVLDPGGVLVYAIDAEQAWIPGVRVSFDGSHGLLSWHRYESMYTEAPALLYAGRSTVDGVLIDETPVPLSAEGEHVLGHAAGFDGTNHVIAWYSFEAGLRASRVTPGGTVLDPDGFLVDDIPYRATSRLDMAAANGRSIVVWSGFPTEIASSPAPMRAAEIATDGATTSLQPYNAFPHGLSGTVTAHPDGALVLWSDAVEPIWDYSSIIGMRLDAAGMRVPDSTVTPASPASRQDVKSIASDGQSFFVVWTDTRHPTGQGRALYGARVGADGTPIDAEVLELTTTPVYWADVVFDGANFVVSWLDPPCCCDDCGDAPLSSNTVRVNPDGQRLDEAPLQLPICGELARASDGTHTLMVGVTCFDGINPIALLLNQDGAAAGDPIPLPNLGYHWTAASFDGSGYLVVRLDQGQLFGQRMTQAGALEGEPFMIVDGGVRHVEIAADVAGHHLVVWETWENDGAIWATRVNADGQVLDPGGLLVTTLKHNGSCDREPDLNTCGEASVVFDGDDYIVAWRELSSPGLTSSLDLYGAKLSPEGEVSPPFVISQAPEREGAPFLAVNGAGEVLAAYNRFVPGAPYDTRRAVATLLP
jgi:hypothetical protein